MTRKRIYNIILQVSCWGLTTMNDNEKLEYIEHRLQEGNISEEEMYPEWNKILDAAYKHQTDPERVLNLCYKLRFTDFIGEDGIDETDEKQKAYIRKKYSDAIYKISQNSDYNAEIRHKAWNMYKNIITSENSVPEEGCNRIFDYLGKAIDKKDVLFNQEIEDTAYFLHSKYQSWQTKGLFALKAALSNGSADAYRCLTHLDKHQFAHKMSADEIKVAYCICDTAIEQRPDLKLFALNLLKNLYNKSENNSASEKRAENILYRIADKHPELVNIIEQDILHKKPQKTRYDQLPSYDWIHIGSEKPSATQFHAVEAINNFPKPKGGLWVSPKQENGLSDWQTWTSEEEGAWQNWCPNDQTRMFYVEPENNLKCLVVNSIADLEPYLIEKDESIFMDSLGLAKDYDCFYIENPRSMDREGAGAYHNRGAYDDLLTGFDVSSLVFLRPNTFTAYSEEEYAQHKELQRKMGSVRQKTGGEENIKPTSAVNNSRRSSSNGTKLDIGYGGGR
ncbi:MAG: hypothetical protein VZR95_01670 [Alphaproteobacteria bacterium]